MTQDLELKTLFPGKEVILNSGEKVIIKPFTFGQLPKAMKILQKISGVFTHLVNEGAMQDNKKIAGLLLMVITEGGEDLIELISLGIGKDRAWFDTLESDDGVKITLAFLEENMDFFIKKMMPQLLETMQNFQVSKGL